MKIYSPSGTQSVDFGSLDPGDAFCFAGDSAADVAIRIDHDRNEGPNYAYPGSGSAFTAGEDEQVIPLPNAILYPHGKGDA